MLLIKRYNEAILFFRIKTGVQTQFMSMCTYSCVIDALLEFLIVGIEASSGTQGFMFLTCCQIFKTNIIQFWIVARLSTTRFILKTNDMMDILRIWLETFLSFGIHTLFSTKNFSFGTNDLEFIKYFSK